MISVCSDEIDILEMRLQLDTSSMLRLSNTCGMDETLVPATFKVVNDVGYDVGTCVMFAQLLTSRDSSELSLVPGGSCVRVVMVDFRLVMVPSCVVYALKSDALSPASDGFVVKSVTVVSSPMTSAF